MNVPGRLAILGALLLGASALACASCVESREDTDLKPPPAFVPPPVRPLRSNPVGAERLGFGAGFSLPEVGSDGRTWRWMGSRGEVHLRNDGQAHELRIIGWIPMELMKEPPRIRITLDDHLISTFVEPKRDFRWQYAVQSAPIGAGPSFRLVVETSSTVRAPGDSRDLGISIERVDWETIR